jgi:hypothetical protein
MEWELELGFGNYFTSHMQHRDLHLVIASWFAIFPENNVFSGPETFERAWRAAIILFEAVLEGVRMTRSDLNA